MSGVSIDTKAMSGKTDQAASKEDIDQWSDDLKALKFEDKLVKVAIDDLRNDKDLSLGEAAQKLESYFDQTGNGKIEFDDQVALESKEDENGDGFVTANMENKDVGQLGKDSKGMVDETGIFEEFFYERKYDDYQEDPQAYKDDLLLDLEDLMDPNSEEYQEIEDFIDSPQTDYGDINKMFFCIRGDDNTLTQSNFDNYETNTILVDGHDGEKVLSGIAIYERYLDMGYPQEQIEGWFNLEPGEKPRPGEPPPEDLDGRRAIASGQASIRQTNELVAQKREETNTDKMDLVAMTQLLEFGRRMIADVNEEDLEAVDKINVQLKKMIQHIFAQEPNVSDVISEFIENSNFEKVLAFFDNVKSLNGKDALEIEDCDILRKTPFSINDDGSIYLTES